MQPYKIVSELLSSVHDEIHPNVDMLIIKPALYIYLPNEQLESAKETGVKADQNGMIDAYFSRIPETVDTYREFLQTHTPLKIMISKLKHCKDQKITINPVNIPGKEHSLTEDDIKKISKKNKFFFQYFTSGRKLEDIPHARLHVQSGVLPAFTYKIIKPKPQIE